MKSTSQGKLPFGEVQSGTRIRSLGRGCRLLLWIAEQPNGATAKEAAFATQISLPTTYHLLNTLIDEKLLARDDQRRYTLGPRAATLAQAYLRGSSVPDELLSAVRGLAETTQETVYLADWGEYDIRVLASVEGSNIVRVAEVASGPYEDAHARANGKVLLAYAWPELRDRYLSRHPMNRRTPKTICDPALLIDELELVRSRGYAYDEQEFSEGVCCVAAPVLGDGQIVAALAVSVPAERFERNAEALTLTLLDVIAHLDVSRTPVAPAKRGGARTFS